MPRFRPGPIAWRLGREHCASSSSAIAEAQRRQRPVATVPDLRHRCGNERGHAAAGGNAMTRATAGTGSPGASAPPAATAARRLPRRPLLAALALGACAGPEVRESALGDASRLPAPERVVVLDIAVTPQEVRLDSGVAGRVQQTLDSRPLSEQQLAVARAVASRVADATVAELRAQGISATRAAAPPAAAGTVLLAEGQLLFADEGNTTRARWIGFGAGRSAVGVDAQLYHAAGAAPPRALEDFVVTVEAPRTPGLAGGLAAGRAAGRAVDAAILGGSAQALTATQRGTVEAEADAVGRALGRRIAAYLSSRGWRPPA
jgi:hypothetical protein